MEYTANVCIKCNRAFMSSSKTPKCTYCDTRSKKHKLLKTSAVAQVITETIQTYNFHNK